MRGMVPEDVYDLTWAGDPRVSPDGRTIAYVVTWIDREANEYRSAIWLAAADGSTAPRRFTTGPKRDASPRWSPDGSMLAFTSNRDGDAMDLYVIPVAGGEPLRLTRRGKEDVAEIAWSPDATRIVFASRVRDAAYDEEDERKRAPRRITRLQYKLDSVGWLVDRPKHLFVVAADGEGEPRQLTYGEMDDAGPAWSPDGTRIAFCSSRHDEWDVEPASDVFVVAADGGEPERLTATDGACSSPSWSPDGTRIAYLYSPGVWDGPRHGRVAVIPAGGGEPSLPVEHLDRNCQPYPSMREPIWDGDGALVFALEDRGSVHLYRTTIEGRGEVVPLVQGERAVTGFDLNGGTLAYTASDPVTPAELFVGDRRISEHTTSFTAGRELVAPERFTAVSADGSEVDAWIVRPAGYEPGRRYPVLLNIHGGPFTQYANRFFDEFQVYAGAGYAVVYANPRGSSGSTEAWGRAIRGPSNGGPGWGSVDYEDVMAALDTALERFDVCDPERVGVLGGSYGGYLTSWIVGHTDRFAAACSERAVNDLISDWGSSDAGWWFRSYIGSWRFEDPEAWRAMSPVTYADRIRTPLLILHSEHDLRCNVEQAEQLFTTLRVMRREVEFVRFPAESHELSRSGSPVHRVMRFDVLLDWFARYLQKG